MSEFYDSIDRAFRDELSLCVTKSQGEFYDSSFASLPDGSYKLQLRMRKQPVDPITTVRLLNTYYVQTGVSTLGAKAYAEIIVKDMTRTLYREYIRRININDVKGRTDNGIEKVIFNPPATIVFFKDGKKVVVKCQDDDDWDEEKALAMAIVKHDHGLSVFNKTLEKAERRYPDSNINIDMPSLVDGITNAAKTIIRIFGCEQDIERCCENCKFNRMDWSAKYEKDMPFCLSDNPMINHCKSITEDYEDFYCKDFEPREEK